MAISTPPAAPNPLGTNFAAEALAFTQWMHTAAPEFNAAVVSVNDDAVSSAASAESASDAADAAQASQLRAADWAEKMGSPVDGAQYSAKYWADIAQEATAALPNGSISDSTTTATSTWSSSKIAGELDNKASTAALSTGLETKVGGSAADNIGYLNIPQNSESAAYTLVLTDAGKHILHPSADTTARTFTIPSNASVPYPVGTAITFVNQASAGVLTIAISSDTMRLAGPGTTGSRTLSANGVATALKIAATQWMISGAGLT